MLLRYSTPALLWEAYKAAMRSARAGGRDPTAAAEQLLAAELGPVASARLYRMLFSRGAEPDTVMRAGGGAQVGVL